MEYITASCVIRENRIHLNGRFLWEPPSQRVPSPAPPPPADFLLSAYQHFGFPYPKFYKMDLLSKLGWLAAELLLNDGFNAADYRPEAIAVVLANSSSSLDTDYKYFATVDDIPSPALFVYTLPNIVVGEICIRHKFKGENAFFILDSFDADFLAQYVHDLLENGPARACICGWVEVLGDNYTAALFLIEEKNTGLSFTADNLNRCFNPQNTRHE
jgi:hypothetical protein